MSRLCKVVALGRGMPPPVKALVDDYLKRLVPFGGADLVEVAEYRRTGSPGERDLALGREAISIRKILANTPYCALDIQGRTLSSEAFSQHLHQARQAGQRQFCFLIGGPDGLHPEILQQADWRLSLGPMTFPHLLTRVLLLEQIYRAMTLLHHLPYHR